MWPGDFLSNFNAAKRLSLNFCKLSMQPGDLLLTSVNFPCGQETFHQLPSSFRAAGRPSATFHELSVRQGDPPLISVIFPFRRESFREIPSSFFAVGRPSVNFCQVSVRTGDLLLITEGLLATRKGDGVEGMSPDRTKN